MAENKTQPTTVPVAEYLAQVEPERRRTDAQQLDQLFQRVTGWQPKMWGESIVGYGRYDYTYDSGRSGTTLATGFAPRKSNFVVYIMPGYTDFSDILGRLGPHRKGKSCLYLTRLEHVDTDVLAELIRAGVDDLAGRWPVTSG